MHPLPSARLGNAALWELPKTGFLCSRKCPAAALLKIYDWAQQARDAGVCVMSGYHTIIENDVWKILLKGEQPLILVSPRGLPKRIPAAQRAALDAGRLLVVSPFAADLRRATRQTAHRRNIFILSNAENMTIGHAMPDGRLAAALAEARHPSVTVLCP